MTRLEIGANANDCSDTSPEFWRARFKGEHLKCPACAAEVDQSTLLAFDADLKCTSCGAVYEFRQWHESWCAVRRTILANAFPEMTWLASGYDEFVPAGGGMHEHLREIR